MKFTFDPKKEKLNVAKHGVSLSEGSAVINNPATLVEYDSAHSTLEEDRFRAIGFSATLKTLVVIFCESDDDECRIISARVATKAEVKAWQSKN